MSRDKPEQLVFSLPHAEAVGSEDFLVSPCNEAAFAAVSAWPGWQHASLALVGPPGSGKSHLVNVWRTRSRAVLVDGAALDETAIATATAAGAIAVEDIDRGLPDERILFHLLNLAREAAVAVLVTSRHPPGELDIRLPDLRSRLRAMALVAIAAPDEALLNGLLVKLFADRQLAVEPPVIAHLLLHMDRTTQAAREVVAAIDRLALATHRRVTRPLAAQALALVQGGRDDA